MKRSTQDLINELKELSAKEEVERLINDRHIEYKKSLQSRGIRFSPDFEDIEPLQTMNRAEYEAYDELNHMRRGISTGWADSQYQEHKEIEVQIRSILEGFDKI